MTDPVPDQQPATPTVAPTMPGPAAGSFQHLNTSGEAGDALHPSWAQEMLARFKQSQDPSTTDEFLYEHAPEIVKGATMGYAEIPIVLPKISAEEANKRYPGMPQAFSEPIDPDVARSQYDHYQKKKNLEDYIAAGSSYPVSGFLASLAGSFANPINLAAGLLTSGAGTLAGISRNLKNVAIENGVVNAGMAGIGYVAEKDQHLAPSLGDIPSQIAQGTVVGVGVHYAFAGMGKAFKQGVSQLKKTSPDIIENNLKTVHGQQELGATPNISVGEAEAAARARGDIEGQTSPLRFNPVNHPSEAPFYGAKSSEGPPVNPKEIGPGISLSRNPGVANNLAGDGGMVAKFDLPKEAKFLDVGKAMDSPEAQEFAKAVEEKTGVKLPTGVTVDDLFDSLTQVSLEDAGKVQAAAKDLGYSGYNLDDKNVHLFDEKTPPSKVVPANPDLVPRNTEDTRREAFRESIRPENAQTYTPELAKEVHEFHHARPLNAPAEPEYMDPVVKEAHDSAMNQLQEWAKTDPELAEEVKGLSPKILEKPLEKFKQEDKIDRIEKALTDKLADCMAGELQ